MDRPQPARGLIFVLAFAGWATLAFVPAWAIAHAWQRALAAVAVRLVAPAGTTIEMVDLELFQPVDLAIFVALCLATAWVPWRRRARAILVGAPVLVAGEVVVLCVALGALVGASGPGHPAAQGEAAGRYADALIRGTGLALAALAWFVLLGHERRQGAAGRSPRSPRPPRPARPPRPGPRAVTLVAVGALLAAAAPSARAHGVGSGEIELVLDGATLTGYWALDLRDARTALGLDPALAGEAGFADLRAHAPELRALLARSVTLEADGRPVALAPGDSLAWNARLNTLKVGLGAACPRPPTRLALGSSLMFDRNPAYRTYFSVEDARVTSVGVLRASERRAAFDVRQFHLGEVIAEFVRDGVGHIWSGIDHMLFLLALLLPAPLLRVREAWAPRPRLGPSTRAVLKVVTAFTAAHSITLSLAFFGIVRLPSQWIEVGIALSVFAAAWNNLRPFLPGRAWVMAFGFGLVHGLGFAGALGNLSLPRHARVLSLAAFNGGVELGQLAVVAALLPLLYLGSRRDWYPRAVMGTGSLGIAWLAVMWILERAFNLSLFARG